VLLVCAPRTESLVIAVAVLRFVGLLENATTNNTGVRG
jgi:hypothetical protein